MLKSNFTESKEEIHAGTEEETLLAFDVAAISSAEETRHCSFSEAACLYSSRKYWETVREVLMTCEVFSHVCITSLI